MHIVSKRKDYYDGVISAVGVDKTIVYVRETTVFDESRDFPEEFGPSKYTLSSYNDYSPFRDISNYEMTRMGKLKHVLKYQKYGGFIVGFCGKLYVGWKLHYEEKQLVYPFASILKTYITYDLDEVEKYIKINGYRHNMSDSVNYIRTYNKTIDIFRKLNAPIFVYDQDYDRLYMNNDRKSAFVINPLLKEYDFYKIFDSFRAFQEISMFLGGVLGKGEKEIVEVQDKYKIAQHGFDKYSFRKDKEIKK
jgi:hypothetical protein